MFGYSLELEKRLDIRRTTAGNEGFKTSIKGFKTKEEAQRALEEAENEARMSNEYRVLESRIYEY
ncbi:hypothetical protein NIES267_30810 [Calothrix parasitica NIES-267]|uniref:Uncharacterized protein n=1 Tax=Calothrix parasitica NIES-267 TaxID=1973488 RepID=A0A1Z4LQQ5_9CYAN|nr:hypothetical protein NIES267_30810 [Calothrix parasitica NIES-267]